MKILKIGKWSKEGDPVGFIFETESGDGIDVFTFSFKTGVRVNGVEIVEWTEARRSAMNGAPPVPKERKTRTKRVIPSSTGTGDNDSETTT